MKIRAFITRIHQGVRRRRTTRDKLSGTERREGEREGEGEGDERHEERHERQMEAESYEDVTLRWPEELLIQTLSNLDVTSILRCRQVRSPLLFNLPRLILIF
jgi:hypothetical protein